MPAELSLAAFRPDRERTRKLGRLATLYRSFWKRFAILALPIVSFVRMAERLLGPRCLPFLLAPIIGLDVVRRLVDYRAFQKLRGILPDAFWRGLPAWKHFLLMVRNWESSLASGFLCDRLNTPAWSERIRILGTRPDRIPESDERPVIVVHLHTGPYGFLHRWLRSQGLRASSFRLNQPKLFETAWAQRIFQRADRASGLEGVPQVFMNQLRAALRFLRPGHILSVAIDVDSASAAVFNANGHDMVLSQGVVNLAVASRAILVPAAVVARGICRFEIRFGTPVPDALLDEGDPRPAIQFILDQLWKDVEEEPSVLGWVTLLNIDQRSGPRIFWPWP